ncbi:MAG: TMEM165/GDT1 family protein [Promethearchaeota archaeon]
MEIWIILISFGIVFLGELGDKTQLIVFNLALKYKEYYKLGLGITIGLGLIVTLGVLIGTILIKIIPLSFLTLISGIIFIILGILGFFKLKKLYIERDGMNSKGINKISSNDNDSEMEKRLKKLKDKPFLIGFLFIIMMELGDKTQILTITLSSLYNSFFEVWLGAFFALVSIAWLGIFIGSYIAKKIPKIYLQLISSLIFMIVGLIVLISLI